MRQPTDAAVRCRGEEAAASGEAGVLQPLVPLGERSIDLGRKGRALDRELAVGLHKHEQDVLAAQSGQQPVGGGPGDGIVLDLGGEHAPVVDVRPHRIDLVNDETGRQR